MYHLNESVKSIWAIQYIRSGLFYTFFTFLLEFLIIDDLLENWPLPYLAFTLIVFVLMVIRAFVLPNIRYNRWKFDVRLQELYLERGILTMVKTTAPYVRIQHLDVRQSIFERYYQLATLVVYTAGTKGADIIIPGLPVDYAYQLRDSLNNFTKEDEV